MPGFKTGVKIKVKPGKFKELIKWNILRLQIIKLALNNSFLCSKNLHFEVNRIPKCC